MAGTLSRAQSLLLGVVVLAALVLGGVGIFTVGSKSWLWSDTFHVRAGFPDVNGISVGTRVRINGVDAGEVVEVPRTVRPGDPVTLRLRIDGRHRDSIRTDATARIVGEGWIGAKVINIEPGSLAAHPVEEDALIACQRTPQLEDLVAQVDGILQDVRKGEGTLGKLMKKSEAYDEAVETLRQSRGALVSIQQGAESLKQDADAIKTLPIIRSYVVDPHQLLVRPECERHLKWFREQDLFEPGSAVLTASGRQELDKLAPWLGGLKHKGSEIVVAGFAQAGQEPQTAATLTQKQSEAVCNYLIENHAVQKMGWFARRKVTALGLGVKTPPGADKDKLPTPRLEVLVFVPQGT